MTSAPTPPPRPAVRTIAPDEAAIDDDILAVLNADPSALVPDPKLAGRVKRQLLNRIAAAETRHLTVQGDALAPEPGRPFDAGDPPAWQAFLPGIAIKVLNESEGVMSYLLRFAPGAVLPAHRHPRDEECVVLEGALRIGELTVPAGGFHLAHEGALHSPITSVDGALIYLRGAVPEVDQLI